MATYTLEMRDDCQGSETTTIDADDFDEASKRAESETEDWVKGVDWGDDGASIDAWWTLLDENGDEVGSGSVAVEIEPDHDALIEAAGGDTDCDHDWTSEGEGGCRENPGVWSTGGTSMMFASHCRKCGLQRTERTTGSQRNPGDHDTVEYSQPDSWCPDCEREECRADRSIIHEIAAEFDRLFPDQVDESISGNGQTEAGHKGHENDGTEWPCVGWFCGGGNAGNAVVSIHPHDLRAVLDILEDVDLTLEDIDDAKIELADEDVRLKWHV